MSEYTYTIRYVAVDYKIIRGHITQVEAEVKELLDSNTGWILNGDFYMIQTDNTSIGVQSMAKQEQETL